MRIRYLFNKIYDAIISRWYGRIDIISTIFTNLRMFPLKTAIKFPVFIYSGVQILSLGNIVFNCRPERGMIKIGVRNNSSGRTRISGKGTYIFNGGVIIINRGTVINNNGVLTFGKNVFLGYNVFLSCQENINLGNYVRIGFNTIIMDTDFHYVVDTNTHTVRRNTGSIVLNEGVWVASCCRIMKNTYIPKNCIIAGGSLTNKSYAEYGENSVFAGTPAKLVATNKRRICNEAEQARLSDYFKMNQDKDKITLNIDDMDKLCYENFFLKKSLHAKIKDFISSLKG